MSGREGKPTARRAGNLIFVMMLVPVVAFLLFFLWGFLKGMRSEPQPAHTEASVIAPLARHRGDIVLILDDVGFDHQPLVSAMAIDPSVNFAVLPNGMRSS